MSNIRNMLNILLVERLLNEWLVNWKEKAPNRFVDKWKKGVPEYWLHKLQEKVLEDWQNRLSETHDVIQAFDKPTGKHKYYELAGYLKNKYEWVDSMNAGKIWNAHTNEGEEPNHSISWKDFLSQLVEILLAKTHCLWNDSHIELLYPLITLKTDALVDDLIPNVYKAELHGRRQPQSWEDFLIQAIELLLAGKRQWNQEEYPDISEQIKAIVKSLVSNTYKQHIIVKELYSDWAHKWRFLSSQREEYDEYDDEEGVQYTSLELEEIAKNIDDERVENIISEEPNLDYFSEFNLGDDPELRWFANQLPKFIEVKNPYKHRINVVLKSNRVIAEQLKLSDDEAIKFGISEEQATELQNLFEEKVRELKRRLKKKLQPYKVLLYK